jgi:hypothetical protein
LEQDRATDYYECIPKLKANKMEIQVKKYSKLLCEQTTPHGLHRKPETLFIVGKDW